MNRLALLLLVSALALQSRADQVRDLPFTLRGGGKAVLAAITNYGAASYTFNLHSTVLITIYGTCAGINGTLYVCDDIRDLHTAAGETALWHYWPSHSCERVHDCNLRGTLPYQSSCPSLKHCAFIVVNLEPHEGVISGSFQVARPRGSADMSRDLGIMSNFYYIRDAVDGRAAPSRDPASLDTGVRRLAELESTSGAYARRLADLEARVASLSSAEAERSKRSGGLGAEFWIPISVVIVMVVMLFAFMIIAAAAQLRAPHFTPDRRPDPSLGTPLPILDSRGREVYYAFAPEASPVPAEADPQ